MKRIIRVFVSMLAVLSISSTIFVQPAFAEEPSTTCDSTSALPLLSLPHWYRGVRNVVGGKCEIMNPGTYKTGIKDFVIQVGLNGIDIAIHLVGYIAFGFILYGGIQFVLSQGSSDKAAKARTTILNASIGLVLAISSSAIVNLVWGVTSATTAEAVVTKLINMASFAIGAAAVIVIIIAGFSMVTSGDKPDSVAKARNAILYSAIGLAVIVFANVLIAFIYGRF